ncbi:nuclear protein MDM1 isoform X1 [Takifugu rubripes]|uniref:Nuclear protein MDM1 n=1 Tax=Takifugu rubripes TaxID=31033 RepID=A0A674MWH1_TAKRU|nr:nuclear protein MDM1 isoform X1 [Takifugu rubripes]
MTVGFKSEYQKSFRVPRPTNASPHRSLPSAGLRSDHMGASREPCLQRRRRLVGPGGSCRTLLAPTDPGPTQASRIAPSKEHSKGSSLHRKDPKPATSSGGPPVPQTPPVPRPNAEPEQEPLVGLNPKPESGHHSVGEPQPASKPAAEPAEKSANMSNTLHSPQRHPPDGQQPSANQVLRWKAGLTSGDHRSGGHTSEYHQQFGSKKLGAAASPILTADQVLHSSRRAVPPFKNSEVRMETEYRQSYKDHIPPAKPRLHKHLEAQRVPLFHMHMKREGSKKKPRLQKNDPSQQRNKATHPPQVQRLHRKSTEYQSSFRSPLYRIQEEGGATDGDASQVVALRRLACSYRRRAWGVNFCREHLNQLQSEHTVLWEPAETTASDPSTPPPATDRHRGVEALHLPLNSSESTETHREALNDALAEAGEEEDTDEEEEGRLPTPRLKMLPVQRTHHDLTTPATGGAMLVGKLKCDGDSPAKQGHVSVVSVATGAGPLPNTAITGEEGGPEVAATHVTPHLPSPIHNPAKLTEVKPQSPKPPPVLLPPPPAFAPPPHCIQGSLRMADFQHNGALGLRSREPHCPGGGCGTDSDDRLSVMSWRSAASCSEASAVLERAQRRRDEFWGRDEPHRPAESR